jgi:predicted enzyme related to lactoylglutathione lyase
MFIKIMYFSVVVSNQNKALEFYTKLGFEKRIDYPGPEGRFLTMGFKGQDVEMILWEGTPVTATDNSEDSVIKNPGIIFIESEDLRKDFDVLLSKNVTFIEEAPVDYPWGVRITALDPDGNRIALRQRKSN